MTTASEMEVPWRSTVLRSVPAELRARQGGRGFGMVRGWHGVDQVRRVQTKRAPIKRYVPFRLDHDPGFVERLASRQLLELARLVHIGSVKPDRQKRVTRTRSAK